MTDEQLKLIYKYMGWKINEELINEMSDHGLPLEYKAELLSRLEQIDDLKCCGNCTIYEAGSNVCPVDQLGTREGWEYCEKWESDNFAQKDRMQEDYNGGN